MWREVARVPVEHVGRGIYSSTLRYESVPLLVETVRILSVLTYIEPIIFPPDPCSGHRWMSIGTGGVIRIASFLKWM